MSVEKKDDYGVLGMGSEKYTPQQVVGYEDKVKTQIENNLKGIETNLVRLMNVLTDRKAYDKLKEVERVRKRFSFLVSKNKNIFPQKVLRQEDYPRFADPRIVNAMILVSELIYRDTTLFYKLIPTIEDIIFNPIAENTLTKLLHHISLMLTRLERLMILKLNVKSSSGDLALKLIREEVPEYFPKHFKGEIRKELEKNKFEEVQLNLLQDEKYEKAFFEQIVGAAVSYEQNVVQDILQDIVMKFEVFDKKLTGLEMGQEIIKSQQDALGKDIATVYNSIQEMRTAMEVKVNDYLVQSQQEVQLLQQQRVLETQVEGASAGNRDALVGQLLQVQMQYQETTQRLEANINAISANLFSVLEQQKDIEMHVKTELGSDWEQLKGTWQLMKEGKVSKKTFVKKALGTVGKGFLRFFSPIKF